MPTAIIIDDSGSTRTEVKHFRLLDVMIAITKRLLSNHSNADVFSMTDLARGTAKPLSVTQISAMEPQGGTPLYEAIGRAFDMGYDRFYVICDGSPSGGFDYPDVIRGSPMPHISSIATILVIGEAEHIPYYLDPSIPFNFFTDTLMAVYVADKL
jgi:hypothetical protein